MPHGTACCLHAPDLIPQEFPAVMCWTMPHVIHIAVASVSLVIFFASATLFMLAEMELNLASKSPFAMANSK